MIGEVSWEPNIRRAWAFNSSVGFLFDHTEGRESCVTDSCAYAKKSVELDKYIICLMVGKFHRAYVHISNRNIQTTPKGGWQGGGQEIWGNQESRGRQEVKDGKFRGMIGKVGERGGC
jgi:hypothetical protein